jgi:DNA-binding winged helix-turn-helix (wHTH) protein/Tol biopolymer transport system component
MYRFGEYTLHIEKAILRKDEDVLLLPPRVFDLLVLLVTNGEGVVLKEELLRSLWPDVTVEESNLSQSVFTLRRKLGQTPSGEEYVQSVPRKGYRLSVPVEQILSGTSPAEVSASSPLREQSPSETERPGRIRKSYLLPIAFVLSVPLVLAGIDAQVRSTRLSTLSYTQLTRDGMDKRGSAHARGGPVAALVTDGSRIYFTQGAPGETTIGEVSVSGGDTATIPVIFAMTQVLDYSPARSELLIGGYTAPASSHRLWAMALPGGASHPIGEIEASDAAWSPDGTQIAFTKGEALYRSSSDGAGVTLIANLSGIGWRPRWSPDAGTIRLTVVDDRSKDPSLWETRIDGSGLHPLLSNRNVPSTQCCGDWSNDGKRFVFQATHDGKSEIWAMPESTGLKHLLHLDSPQKLTSAPGDLLTPKLAGDGTTMYVLGQQLRGELVQYLPQQHQFLPYLGGKSFDFVECSHDGKWIAYVAYPEGTLWRSRPDGTEKVQLTFFR